MIFSAWTASIAHAQSFYDAPEVQQRLMRRISPEVIIPFIGYGVLVIIACLTVGWAFTEFVLNADRRAALRSIEESLERGGLDIPVLEKLCEDPDLIRTFLARLRKRDPDKARVYAVIVTEIMQKRRDAGE